MSLDEILKNVRGVATGAYNAFKSGQSPFQYARQQIAPPVISPVPDVPRPPISFTGASRAIPAAFDAFAKSSGMKNIGIGMGQAADYFQFKDSNVSRLDDVNRNLELARKLSQSGNTAGSNFLLKKTAPQTQDITRNMDALNQERIAGAKNLAAGGTKLLLNAAGLKTLGVGKTALDAGLSGVGITKQLLGNTALASGLGAVMAKATGSSVPEAIGESIGNMPKYVGVNRFTGPLAEKALGKFGKTMLGRQVGGRTITGLVNTAEDELFAKIDGIAPQLADRLMSFGMGALLNGTANDDVARGFKARVDRYVPDSVKKQVENIVGDLTKEFRVTVGTWDPERGKMVQVPMWQKRLFGDRATKLNSTMDIQEGEILPLESSTKAGNDPQATSLPLEAKPTELSTILKPNAEADNMIRDALIQGDVEAATQLHKDLSVDTKLTPLDQLMQEADQTTATMKGQVQEDMQGKYGEYTDVVGKMKKFLGMAAENKSTKTGELFREHIPEKVFGVSSDEVAADLGMSEQQFMKSLMDDIANKDFGSAKAKVSTLTALKDKLKLDPQFYTIIKNLDETIAVSAQATPKTMAKQQASAEKARQRAMIVADRQWRKMMKEKYKLQTPTQKTNAQLKSITGAIKENTNDGLPSIPDDIPTHKRTGFDSIKDFGKSLILTSRKILSDMGVMGKEAANRIDQYHANYRKMAGGAVADYEQSTQGLLPDGIERVLRFLDGQQVTLSSQEAQAASALRAKLDEFGSAASQAQLEIQTSDGKKIPFSMRENYLPHIVDIEKLKTNRTAAIDHFIATGQMQKDTAAKFVDDIINGAEVGDTYRKYFPNVLPKKYGNLETARLLDWSPEALRYDKKLLPDYFEAAGKRIQGALTFGANNELVNKILEGVAKEGGNTSLAEDIIGRNLGYKQDPQYVRQASGVLRQVQGAMKLGLSAISNATQSVNTATTFGIRRTFKNIISALTDPASKQFTERTGAVLEQTMKDMQDEISGTGPLSKVTAPAFSFVERLNRTIAANTGKDFAQDMFNKLLKNTTDANTIKSLEKMGIDVASALKKGSLSPEDLVTAGQRAVDLTQFKVDPIDMPPLWASSGAKILTQFKNFAYQQGKFIINEVGAEAKNGNFAPLTRYLILGAIVGEPFADIKAWIRGKERPTGAARVVDNMQQVGGLGIISDAVKAVDGGTSRIASFIMGPTVSDAVNLTSNIGSASKGKPLPLAKQAVNAIPIVGGPIANRVFPSTTATPTTDNIKEDTGGATSFLSDKTDYSAMDQKSIDDQLKNIKEQKDKLLENKGVLGFGKLSEQDIESKIQTLDQEAEQLKSTSVFGKIKEVEAMASATPYDKEVKRDKAFALIEEVQKLPEELRADTLKKLGISSDESAYFAIAKGEDQQKYEYVSEKAKSVKDIIPFLITVNGKKIASTGVVDKLYEDGIITKQEKAWLNAQKWDEKAQKFIVDRDYRASQAGASTAAAKKKLKALNDLLEVEVKGKQELLKQTAIKLPSYSRNLDSILKARSPSSTGLDSVLSMYNKTAEKVRHLKPKVG
jgi:hypothetical protein